MHVGAGVNYLLSSVAAGDGDRDLATPLTRYYTANGTPPGVWHGSGVAALGLTDGEQVTEQQLQLLIDHGLHPLTADKLGRAYPRHPALKDRVARRAQALDGTLSEPERADAIARITAEEQARTRHAVAGYEYTFSVPKSVSVLWGLADAGTQQLIANAHHEAIAAAITFTERHLAATRTGATKPADSTDAGGAVVQEPVTGLACAWFDHYDSRSADPQLHTHVAIAAKVQTASDGRWRALDGRPFHHATVAVSELHKAILADILTRDLGVAWETRGRADDRNPAWEIAGVPDELLVEFASRSADIDARAEVLIDEYTARHGRTPNRTVIVKLRQQATLETRQPKHVRSLADLTADWRARAAILTEQDPARWAQSVLDHSQSTPLLHADDVPLDLIADLGQQVMAVVSDRRSTWRRWNLHAEASRQTMGWRFRTANDRQAVVDAITIAAEQTSMRLTPAETVTVPAQFRRPDGTSQFRPHHGALFTSEALYAAEERLLALSRTADGPTVDPEMVPTVIDHPGDTGWLRLSDDQAEAVVAIATSGRVVDLLVGPAGTGKTTTLRALREAWEKEHGTRSVVGLAPSATAAKVLADELGIATENTAKWLTDHRHKGLSFSKGQLVIIDEASLAGTFTLDQIANHAATMGAKVLLVGDWAQLQAVEAGGVFALLADDRTDTPELADLHRFTNEWEKTTTLQLRHGDLDAIDAYLDHGRVHDGDSDAMRDEAYAAWQADLAQGRTSILIADDRATVADLNSRAREDRIRSGHVDPSRSVRLAEGTRASVGDLVITRHNDRRLVAGSTGWVRNGDRWVVTQVGDDGSVTIRRSGCQRGAAVILPAAYVSEHLDLGYGITAQRAQGVTTDTAHVIVSASTCRETLYVAMTRGRHANTAYVATDRDTDRLRPERPADARAVLAQVLQTIGAELSAHQAQQQEHERWHSIPQWVAEYRTILDATRRQRVAAEVARAGGMAERRLEYVLGLVPRATGPMDPEYADALRDLETRLVKAAQTYLQQAMEDDEPWLRAIGRPPTGRPDQRWNRVALTVAAYRACYGIDSDAPLGHAPHTPDQRTHRARAQQALNSLVTQPGPSASGVHPPTPGFGDAPPGRPSPSLTL